MLSENIDIIISEGVKKGVEKAMEKAVQKGLEQGLEQGEKRGNAAMFKALVAIRFGSVPDHIVAQIDTASADQLLKWGERLFVASTLEDVFRQN